MARPVALCMRSMVGTTGLGCGAGVVALCSFSVTLSPQSRGFGRLDQVNRGLRRVAKALTHPLSLLPFTGRPGKRRWGRNPGSGAIAPVQKTCAARQSGPEWRALSSYRMKSMRNPTGLGSGAGVAVLRRFPVTLSSQSPRSVPRSGSATCSGDPPQTLTHPPSRRLSPSRPPVKAAESQRSLRPQERQDLVDHGLGLVEQEQVAATFDDPQPRRRHPPGHEPRVGHGNHRIVVAGEDQRRLRHPV